MGRVFLGGASFIQIGWLEDSVAPPLSIFVKANKVHLYSNRSRFSVPNINYTLYNVMWKFFRCF